MEDKKITGKTIIGNKRIALCGGTAEDYFKLRLSGNLTKKVSNFIIEKFAEHGMPGSDRDDPWSFFEYKDWDNVKLLQYHVDTRDFHCNANEDKPNKKEANIDFDTLLKYPNRFIYTKDEVLKILRRLFDESGGHNEWRFLSLDTQDEDAKNWLKYIRIYRVNETETFVICNQYHRALRKEALASKVNIRHLNAH